MDATKFPWLHPNLADFPKPLAGLIVHAQNFSDAMWGAMLLYNYLLARKKGMDDSADQFQEEISGWAGSIRSRKDALSKWDVSQFWRTVNQSGHIPERTCAFVNHWLDLVRGNIMNIQIVENTLAHQLIRDREYQLKRSRSRFENPRRLEVWSGRSGTAQLNYRWPVANNIVNDILDGLQRH